MVMKRLKEEQEWQVRQRLTDKDEEIENLKRDLEYRDQEMNQQKGAFGNKDEEIARLKADMDRLRAEAQAKIAQAQERIKELNQKLLAQAGTQWGMERQGAHKSFRNPRELSES